jgi:lipoprotein-releasing system permease protein
MKLTLLTEISKALLLARWKQTLIAAIGVMFSITMFITLLSFMSGLNDLLDGLIINRTPHVRLYREIEPNPNQPIIKSSDFDGAHHFIRSVKPKNEFPSIRNSRAILNSLRNDKRVKGVSPKVSAQVFYNVGSTNLTGLVNGVEAEEEARLYMFRDYVTAGNYIDLKNVPNSIILGKGVADQMQANVGDAIQLTTAKGEQFTLKVVGYFQSGLLDVDKVQSYVSVKTAQKLLGVSDSYFTDLQVKLYNVLDAPLVAKEFAHRFEINALDIQTANAQFETGSYIRTLISYAVGITLLVVSGFGIYNILNMMIYEKMDSIAILKATGFSGSDVNMIFIGIALFIGLFGGITGLLFGYIMSSIIDQIPFVTAALPTIKTFPINYNPKFYMIGIGFSIITTYFAGYFPARKAAGIDPVVIIRGK